MGAVRIVLGLGNPGLRYRCTRHNIGFRVLDRLARSQGARFDVGSEIGRRAWTAEAEIAGSRVVLAKPRTYMNRSGRAAIALRDRHGTAPEELLLVYDDADLALGRIRIRNGGSSGGHQGVQSLIDVLGTSEFPRVRLGIRGAGRQDQDLADYVLEPFSEEEESVVSDLVDLAVEAVERILRDGLTEAMDCYNGRSVAPPTDEAEMD